MNNQESRILYPIVYDLSDGSSSIEDDDVVEKVIPVDEAAFDCSAVACLSLSNFDFNSFYESPHPLQLPVSHERRSTATTIPIVEPDEDEGEINDGCFDDTYVLTRLLKETTTSCIWECIHRKESTRYAVKVFHTNHNTSKQDSAIQNEIDHLEALVGKPGVLQLRDVFKEKDKIFVVTELANGGNLSAHIKRKGRPQEEEVRILARCLLQGMLSLKEQNIIHGNIRPEHVLLKNFDFDHLVIGDFAAAATLSDAQEGVQPKLSRGSNTAYTAPECLNRLSCDTQADMWSLGVLVYFALVGYLPFERDTETSMTDKIRSGLFSFQGSEWRSVSKEAKRFVSALLQVEKDVRLDALEALQHSWLQIDDIEKTVAPGTRAETQRATTNLFKKWIQRRQKEPSLKSSAKGKNIGRKRRREQIKSSI